MRMRGVCESEDECGSESTWDFSLSPAAGCGGGGSGPQDARVRMERAEKKVAQLQAVLREVQSAWAAERDKAAAAEAAAQAAQGGGDGEAMRVRCAAEVRAAEDAARVAGEEVKRLIARVKEQEEQGGRARGEKAEAERRLEVAMSLGEGLRAKAEGLEAEVARLERAVGAAREEAAEARAMSEARKLASGQVEMLMKEHAEELERAVCERDVAHARLAALEACKDVAIQEKAERESREGLEVRRLTEALDAARKKHAQFVEEAEADAVQRVDRAKKESARRVRSLEEELARERSEALEDREEMLRRAQELEASLRRERKEADRKALDSGAELDRVKALAREQANDHAEREAEWEAQRARLARDVASSEARAHEAAQLGEELQVACSRFAERAEKAEAEAKRVHPTTKLEAVQAELQAFRNELDGKAERVDELVRKLAESQAQVAETEEALQSCMAKLHASVSTETLEERLKEAEGEHTRQLGQVRVALMRDADERVARVVGEAKREVKQRARKAAEGAAKGATVKAERAFKVRLADELRKHEAAAREQREGVEKAAEAVRRGLAEQWEAERKELRASLASKTEEGVGANQKCMELSERVGSLAAEKEARESLLTGRIKEVWEELKGVKREREETVGRVRKEAAEVIKGLEAKVEVLRQEKASAEEQMRQSQGSVSGELEEARKRMEEAEGRANTAETTCKEVRMALHEVQSRMRTIAGQRDEARKELKQALDAAEASGSEAREARKEKGEALQPLRERARKAERDVESLRKDAERLQEEKGAAEAFAAKAKDDLVKAREGERKMRMKLDGLEKRSAEEAERLRQEAEKLRQEAESAAREFKSQIAVLERAVEGSTRNAKSNVASEVDAMRAQVSEIMGDLKEAQGVRHRDRATVAKLQRLCRKLAASITAASRREGELKREVGELRERLAVESKHLAAKDDRVKALAEALAEAQASSKGGNAVDDRNGLAEELRVAMEDGARHAKEVMVTRQLLDKQDQALSRAEDSIEVLLKQKAALERELHAERSSRKSSPPSADSSAGAVVAVSTSTIEAGTCTSPGRFASSKEAAAKARVKELEVRIKELEGRLSNLKESARLISRGREEAVKSLAEEREKKEEARRESAALREELATLVHELAHLGSGGNSEVDTPGTGEGVRTAGSAASSAADAAPRTPAMRSMSQRVADAFASLTPVAASPKAVVTAEEDKENFVAAAVADSKGSRKPHAPVSSPRAGRPQGGARKFGTPLKEKSNK